MKKIYIQPTAVKICLFSEGAVANLGITSKDGGDGTMLSNKRDFDEGGKSSIWDAMSDEEE